MKTFTFAGGIHPEYNKEISIGKPLKDAPRPLKVVLPLSQHIGKPNDPVVKKGDRVEEGQVIGRSDAFVSCPVHSSVTGTVREIKKTFHPVLGTSLSVFIDTEAAAKPRTYNDITEKNFLSEKLISEVREAGLVGMGGATFPTHVKLTVPEGKKVDTLIINGAECEPYLTCDHALMMKKPVEILKGIKLIASAIKPERIFLAVEDNKKAAFFGFEKAIKTSGGKFTDIQPVMVKTKYPQGGEKQLIKAITKREVPPGKLPFDVGCLVQNVGTIFAVYEAVYLNKPLIERIVTLSGDCIDKPGNYVVKIGTTVKDLTESLEIKFTAEPKKIISGGPMMGISQMSMETPVLKGTCGILFLSEKTAREYEETQCVKCAKCVDVCPVNLSPTEISKYVKAGRMEAMEDFWASDCMECGACAYVCPARIPLVQYIKEGKAFLLRKQK